MSVLEAPKTGSELTDHDYGDWIVLTASCDANTGRLGGSNILLAKIQPATPEVLKATGDEFLRRLEVLRQKKVKGRWLLPPSTNVTPALPLSVVEFRLQAVAP